MKINRFLELKCPAAIKQFNSGLSENQVKCMEDIATIHKNPYRILVLLKNMQ